LELLSNYVSLEIDRLALNMDQVQRLQPPENPAKMTDSRFKAYMAEFGSASWELDAVDPVDLDRILTDAVEGLMDPDLWDAAVERESRMRSEIHQMAMDYRTNGGGN
jgi:hypothetical protein